MTAFTLYGMTIFFMWRHIRYLYLRIAAVTAGVLVIALIGISRIYLGVHYPSDVLGGYTISAAWLILVISIYRHYLKKRQHGAAEPIKIGVSAPPARFRHGMIVDISLIDSGGGI